VHKVEKATGSIRGVCILAAVVAVLALAPAAFAQTEPYAGAGGGTQGQVAGGAGGGGAGGGGSPPVASEPTGGDDGGLLAFTGLDVALIAGGGLLLLASGVGLSRLVARNPA
jgi:hypothetical protein